MKNGKANKEPNKHFLLSECHVSQTDEQKASSSFKVVYCGSEVSSHSHARGVGTNNFTASNFEERTQTWEGEQRQSQKSVIAHTNLVTYLSEQVKFW